MITKHPTPMARVWAVTMALIAAVGTLAACSYAMSRHPAVQQTAAHLRGTRKPARCRPITRRPATIRLPLRRARKRATAQAYAESMSRAFHDAAEKVLPAVVTITNTPSANKHPAQRTPSQGDNSEESPFGLRGFGGFFGNNPDFRQFFHDFPSNRRQLEPGVMAMGSGVIVDPSGVVLTNNHVVAGGGDIMVRLHDGREFKGVDIKTDPMTDLAIVRIKAPENCRSHAWARATTWRLAIGCWRSASPSASGRNGHRWHHQREGPRTGDYRSRRLPANRRGHQSRQ